MRMKRFREFFESLADIARMAATRDPFVEAMRRDTMAEASRVRMQDFYPNCPTAYAGLPISSRTWPSRTIQLDVPGAMTTDHIDVRAQRSVEGRY